MNRSISTVVVIGAVILFAVLAWRPITAGLQRVVPSAIETPTQVEATPTADVVPAEPHLQVPEKCMDGSALTVTARDENQISYKCASGAVGARLNNERPR